MLLFFVVCFVYENDIRKYLVRNLFFKIVNR